MRVNNDLQENKIFMFSSVHVWSDTRIFFKEAMTLANEDFMVDFYAIEGPTIYDQSHANICVTTLSQSENKKTARPKRWLQLYKKALASDACYYHFHDFELLAVATMIKKRKPNCFIIYDMHENFPAMLKTKEWIPKFIRRPLSEILAYLEKKWMAHIDAVIFAETSYKEHYEQVNIDKCDVLNLPVWQEPLIIKKRESFTFVYVGDLVRDRGVFEMLQLIKNLKARGYATVCLKLIGPMHSSIKEEVLDFIITNELVDMIKMYGRIPYTEIWEHYASAHVGLCLLHPIPNYMHSLATKLFEYMAAGLPILATNIPDWKELIEETGTGLTTNVFDMQDTTNQAEKMMQSQALRERFSDNGRKAFNSRYNWQTEEKKLVSLYHNFPLYKENNV
ncbi:glycosyltransferase [Listeria monocytogenes]|uniref:glycosyltransferase n=1 Tax=Listeria monocytogenes TaxID=1639 RepID=UPI0010B11D0A|nr:glycosyltransferase [Listeria monocytogenes]EAC3456729.1 glycosyltransferase [Listeria monocytogenes]EAC4365695.1 glycosyltransferase [Listeria monocytogenes]EAC4830990.1 glycosyltransferase [Listeria monocytogenes]EAC8844352.1 glycosyltransferase [Listeria monocytogenes]EAD0273360.1 glycosyltransferase [Listeria monocytogenes]